MHINVLKGIILTGVDYLFENIQMIPPLKRCLSLRQTLMLIHPEAPWEISPKIKFILSLNSLKFSSNVDGVQRFLLI